MLDAERSVVVTGEQHHQDLLWGYVSEHGRSGRVAIELVPVGPRLEARLDGWRVGELTALMSQRYGPTVDSVLRRGGRPGCIARVVPGKRGVEVELRLPAVGAVGLSTEQLPVILPAGGARPAAEPWRPAPGTALRSRKPVWVGVGIVGLLVVIAGVLGGTRERTTIAEPAAVTVAPAPATTTTSAAVTPNLDAVPARSTARKPAVTPVRKPATSVYYRSCAAAQAVGVAPLHTGDPGYRTGLDPDGDGVACELN